MKLDKVQLLQNFLFSYRCQNFCHLIFLMLIRIDFTLKKLLFHMRAELVVLLCISCFIYQKEIDPKHRIRLVKERFDPGRSSGLA